MSAFTPTRKSLLVQIAVNGDRSTPDVIGRIATILDLEIGQQEAREYVQLIHLRKTTLNKEPTHATTSL